MKKTTLLSYLILFFIPSISFAQEQVWWEMMKDPNVNFYTIQNEFNQYWDGREIEKGKGWKVFKRWEEFVEPRVYPSGDRTQLVNTLVEYDAIRNNNLNRNAAGNWSYIGNTSVPTGGGGAGRINCIAFHPNDNNIIFAGSPAGGLWRSNNGGQSWYTNTDQLFNLGVSSIAFDPINPDIIYVGTGDEDGGNTLGQGLIKSTDGGITWNTTGFSYTMQQDISVSKILIHPVNTNELIISTSNGVFKSIDSGNTWSQILTGSFRDLEFKPNDPSIVYAVRAGRFYRSTDSGSSFTQITAGLGSSTSMGRLSVAVTPANSNYVYVLAGNTGNGFYALYRSTDAGLTFTEQSDSPNILGWEDDGSDAGGQAYYDLALAVDRTNANIIYTGGVNIWRSTNGGVSWTIAGHWTGSGAPYVHADIHSLDFNTSNQLYAGCDGGVFRRNITSNVWTDISNNLQIAQMYRIGCSVVDPNLVISGWQDNGTSLSGNPWDRVRGGDGMECLISYTGTSVMYATIYYGRIYKSTDGGDNWNTILNSNGTDEDEEGNWVTPYIQHPTDPGTLLVGKSQIYRTTDAGNTWAQVGITGTGSSGHNALAYAPSDPNYIYACKSNAFFVSTDGTTFTNRTAGLSTSASLEYIAVSNTDPEKVWVCYSGFNNNTKVYFSSDAGLTWSNYSTGLPNIPTNCITYENDSDDALYLGTDLGVYYRDNSTGTWIPFNGGLPNTIVNELEIHYATGKIRAGTYGRGLWESDLYSSIQNDIRVADVLYPTDETCGSSFAPEIIFRNNGDNLITTAQISYRIDNGTVTNFNWNGLLQANSQTQLILPALTTTAGNHTFKIWTSNPNGALDSNPGNDTITVAFNHDPTKTHTVLILNTDCFGEETSWEIEDGTSAIIYQATAGTYPGTNALWVEGGQHNSEHFCLSSACYTFSIHDEEGDGMNGVANLCDVNGSYYLINEAGDTLAENANADCNFGSDATHNFCISANYFASFSPSPTTICEGQSILFSDLSSTGTNSWNWSFPGGTPSSSTSQNPLVTYPNSGSYSVTLIAGDGTNSDSYTINTSIIINEKPDLVFSTTLIDCFGNCNGKIVPIITGGGSAITNYWNTGSSADSLTNLCTGNFSLIVLDEKGCADTASTTITEPASLDVSIVATQATCGVNDGMANASSIGGVLPHDYIWSDSTTNTSLTNLDIGTYTLTVTDANGCESNAIAVITNPNAPQLVSTSSDENCAGDCDGMMATQASGGTGTYSYTWNNGPGTDTSYTDMCAGTYIVTVTDINNCADRDTIVINPGWTYPNTNFIVTDTSINVGQTINYINMGSGSATNYFWDFGDGNGSNFSSTSHTYADTGVYVVSFVVSNHGCNDTASVLVYVYGFVSVDENSHSSLMNIYPNPTSNLVTVDFGSAILNSNLELFDNNGKAVKTFPMNGSSKIECDLNGIGDGIYYFVIQYNDIQLTKKLIIRQN